MNRQAYIAELTQLLYYMTPWDRDAAIQEYDARLAQAEDVDALVREIGSPMKVAVTLHRSYEPSPEPDPNAPKPVPAPAKPEAPPAEEAAEAPVAAEAAPEAVETAAEPDDTPEPIAEASLEEAEEPQEPPEVEAMEITTAEEPTPTEGPAPAPAAEESPEAPAEAPETDQVLTQAEAEGIFSEIFTAATEAQSAIGLGYKPTRQKARPAVLIPYVLACILFGAPVTVALLAVDLMIFGIALVGLALGLYLLTFLLSPAFAGLGNKLVILGVVILGVTAAVAISALGIWFMRTAVIGLVQFLVRFGHEHGYTEEGTV